MCPEKNQVLIVEDERLARNALTMLLAEQGYNARSYASAEALLDEVERQGIPPEVVLADVDLPGMSGLEMLENLARRHPKARAVLITAAEGNEIEDFCRDYPCQYLRKPLNLNLLLSLLSSERAA